MELSEEQKGQIEKTMMEVECSKAFECYKSGLAHLGNIQGIGSSGFLECLVEDSQNCQFSLPFENPSACLCPVRIYIVREFTQ
jgi:hypothetical protein